MLWGTNTPSDRRIPIGQSDRDLAGPVRYSRLEVARVIPMRPKLSIVLVHGMGSGDTRGDMLVSFSNALVAELARIMLRDEEIDTETIRKTRGVASAK